MAGAKQFPADEIEAMRAAVRAIREERGGAKAAWRDVADALNEGVADKAERITQETVRRLAEDGVGGIKIRRALDRYRGPVAPERTVQRDERYPVAEHEFALAIAAGVPLDQVNAARAALGLLKGEPTAEQVQAEIRKAMRDTASRRQLYFEPSTTIPAELDDSPEVPRRAKR